MTWMCQCPRELADSIPACGSCLMDRPHAASAITTTCAECHEPTRQTQLTPGEDQIERCASCHVDYLRRRAHGTTDATRCPEPGCTKTVGEHRADLRALLTTLEQRYPGTSHPRDTEPGILERRGTPGHPFPRKRRRVIQAVLRDLPPPP